MSAGVYAHAGGYVIQRCHNRNPSQGDVNDVTHRKRGLRFEESQLVEFLPRKKKVYFRLLTEALRRVSHVMVDVVGSDGKVVIERLCFLLHDVEKPLNSKR